MIMPETPAAPAAAVRPLVLLVDDYDDSREVYALFLTRVGYRLEEAADGQDAIEKATRLLPDAIVMDLNLPGVDGLELTRRLKLDERTAHIPVIGLTARVVLHDRERALAAGCDGFVRTPCKPEELAAEVARVLACVAREREGGRE